MIATDIRVITRIRFVDGSWRVIRNGAIVFSNRHRTACEVWISANPV